jgi:hypothetical protein
MTHQTNDADNDAIRENRDEFYDSILGYDDCKYDNGTSDDDYLADICSGSNCDDPSARWNDNDAVYEPQGWSDYPTHRDIRRDVDADRVKRTLELTDSAWYVWQVFVVLFSGVRPDFLALVRKSRKMRLIRDKKARYADKKWRNIWCERQATARFEKADERATKLEAMVLQWRTNMCYLVVQMNEAELEYDTCKAKSDLAAKTAGYSPSDVTGM